MSSISVCTLGDSFDITQTAARLTRPEWHTGQRCSWKQCKCFDTQEISKLGRPLHSSGQNYFCFFFHLPLLTKCSLVTWPSKKPLSFKEQGQLTSKFGRVSGWKRMWSGTTKHFQAGIANAWPSLAQLMQQSAILYVFVAFRAWPNCCSSDILGCLKQVAWPQQQWSPFCKEHNGPKLQFLV